jgi:hypothetical protein
MKKIEFIILTLITLAIILPAKISLANEEVTKDSNYLEGIEQRNISDLNNLTPEGYDENQIKEDSFPTYNINLPIKKDESNFLIVNPSDDKPEQLDSNYGDQKPTGGTIPLVDF